MPGLFVTLMAATLVTAPLVGSLPVSREDFPPTTMPTQVTTNSKTSSTSTTTYVATSPSG